MVILHFGSNERAGRSLSGSDRGKSGHHRAGCWITSSGGNPGKVPQRTDRLHRLLQTSRGWLGSSLQVRVKRCGKSAPGSW